MTLKDRIPKHGDKVNCYRVINCLLKYGSKHMICPVCREGLDTLDYPDECLVCRSVVCRIKIKYKDFLKFKSQEDRIKICRVLIKRGDYDYCIENR
jgi:hypothetical protein